MGKRKIIDISTEEKKKKVFEEFNSLNSKNQAHNYFGISDNKQGSEYLKEVAKSVGFNLETYKERKNKPIRYCKECGKEITNKWGKDFCCSSCAAKYNNKRRDKSVYEKVSNKLRKNVSNKLRKNVLKEKYCLNCGKILNQKQHKYCSVFCRNKYKYLNNGKEIICQECGKVFKSNDINRKFCSNACSSSNAHRERYKHFLEHNEEYCKSNYTPKSFKKDFLKEQNNVCAICGCKPEHNGKALVFVLDHIDGDASNNKRENLRLVCPNCDSQLDTFKSKNKYSSRRNYWKEHILKHKL